MQVAQDVIIILIQLKSFTILSLEVGDPIKNELLKVIE